MRMKSIRLRSKIYLSFSAVLVLCVSIIGLVLGMTRMSGSSFKDSFRTDNQVARLVLSIKAERERVTESLRERLSRTTASPTDQQLKSLDAAYERINAEIALTRQLTADPQL